MKFHDRARTMRPDGGSLVPLAVLFLTSLNGPSVPEALRSSVALFFSLPSGPILWAQVILLNIALYAYFAPVFRVHIQCRLGCESSAGFVDLAFARINRLRSSTIILAVLAFVAGRFALFLTGTLSADSPLGAYGLAELPILLLESAANGFFVGVLFVLEFDHRFYDARETLRDVGGLSRMRYSSLFSKIILILAAIIIFMTMQAFSFAGSFYSLATLKSALDIFFLKMLFLLGLVAVMIFHLKRIIIRPLATILDSLKLLNSPRAGSARAIDIVQNDEFSSLFREINSLIQKQQGQLETTSRRLEDIVAGAADPIIAFDAELRLRLFNPAAEAAFGCPREEALGSTLDRLLGSGATGFVESHSGGTARHEWYGPGGKTALMESHISSAGTGAEAWTIAILRDVGRQAEFEENLRRARVEAEDASRMKSEFLANMSHELRTPLNAILGFTQLMDDDRNLTEAQRDRIRIINRSGEHLLSLINDVLDISKIEAGKMELHTSVFDLWEFLDELRELFELKCRRKGLSLYFDRAEDLPRYVTGDLGKLRQIMVNLLGNAVKFTDEGGVSVFCGTEGASVRFAVRDTGRGIPAEEQEAVLRPFVQASTTDHEGGTGLGLAISSRYVAMMGGSFGIQSAPGEGSVFSFTLPLGTATEAPARDDSAALEIQLAEGREVTALVVDDQETNRLVLKQMLERVGFSVVVAVNGREAFDRAVEIGPDLVFMDIKMPVMDGYASVALLKQDPRTAGARVFALTASAFANDEERIVLAGFDGFLAKPFKQGSLYRLIRDRGGLRLEQSRRSQPGQGGGGPVDFREAAALAPDLLSRLSEAALINDFASLAGLAAEMGAQAPSFAQALEEAAAGYDEAAIAALLEGARAQREGGRDGR